MKKILMFLLAGMTLFSSCHMSPESKAEGLIVDKMKKVLYHPESYESVETKLDSAFSPFDSPEFCLKAQKMVSLGNEMGKADDDMRDAKSDMAICSSPYGDAFFKNRYQEAKERFDAAHDIIEKDSLKLVKLADEMKVEYHKKPAFIGYKAYHKYRAKNNAGNTVFGQSFFIFDKDVSTVLIAADMDSEEYITMQQLYAAMKGEE